MIADIMNVENFVDQYFWYIAVLIVLVVGPLWARQMWSQKNRPRRLREVAAAIGASFMLEDKQDLLASLDCFSLFDKEKICEGEIHNILQWTRHDVVLQVFDYDYRHINNMRYSHQVSIAFAKLGQENLPKFRLEPGCIFDKIGDVLGLTDIDFRDYPAFSDKYLLKGSDEGAIRDLFDYKILDFFERTKKRPTVEAQGDKVVVYYPSERKRPEDVSEFVEEAKEIVNALSGAG